MKKHGKIYNKNKNVYQAAVERINYIFDNFEKIIVSCSGGKDSIVLTYLSLEIAKQRNRKIYLFYLDQEFEYNSTILIIDDLMKHEYVIPIWFQIHGSLAITVSHDQYLLEPWNSEEKHKWIRNQKRVAIKKIDWKCTNRFSRTKDGLYGFYGLIKCMEQMFNKDNPAFLIGFRAEESLDRFRACIKNPGFKNINWSVKNKYNGIKFYPIYDWTFADLWVYISKNKIKYNKIYDYFFKKGYSMRDMRISSLMNHKAYQCLVDVQEFDHKLYDQLLDRCNGVKTASIYAKENKIFKVNKLPDNFKTWKEYRDFLLNTLSNKDHVKIFKDRFEKQKNNPYVHKQQVYQIHTHDIIGHKKVNNIDDPEEERKKKWMETL